MSNSFSGITVLGLGPGDSAQLTREAWEMIENSREIYLRTSQHPVVADLPTGLNQISFDELYDSADNVEQVYSKIIKKIVEMGQRPEGVLYAVPGNPYVAETTAPEIIRLARQKGIAVRIVQGLSFIEPSLAALGVDLLPMTTITDALEMLSQHHPLFPVSSPALIAQIHSKLVASEVKIVLMSAYPDEHRVSLVHAAGTPEEVVEEMALYEIDRSEHIAALSSLYVPPLPERSSFEEFQNLIAHLRAPEGCPWDREQTHQSLRRNLLEECYEVLEALDARDSEALKEEFGDLLVQIVLHAQIATEVGEFRMADVIEGIHTKLVRRHPHVFATTELDNAQDVIDNWEHLKSEERQAKGQAEKGMLDSIAPALPALAQAEAYGSRAARVGFDWPDVTGVLDKIEEEIEEIRQAKNAEEQNAEFGDLLFALVNMARWLDIDPEAALRGTNLRFKERFSYIESTAREQGKVLKELDLIEMEALWEEGKSKTR
jgi:tetrapyrrole methylase family protein/MazG family protein